MDLLNYSDYVEHMQKLKEYETLKETEPNVWSCLLKNNTDFGMGFYGMSHGLLTLSLFSNTKDVYSVHLYINSIDDDYIGMWGPAESKEKALKRMEALKAQIVTWDGWIPNEDKVKLACQLTNCWVD
ncbi:MAG: hypothetical protein KDD50_15645 [Bdellovibrionales bacterium]|nr:hypothetical protein [Bdellovibrionales bacterium]